MKTRAMNLSPDVVRVEGTAWGETPPALVLETWGDGDVTHRVRIAMTPVTIEEIALRLWELRAKYAGTLDSMTRVLKGE